MCTLKKKKELSFCCCTVAQNQELFFFALAMARASFGTETNTSRYKMDPKGIEVFGFVTSACTQTAQQIGRQNFVYISLLQDLLYESMKIESVCIRKSAIWQKTSLASPRTFHCTNFSVQLGSCDFEMLIDKLFLVILGYLFFFF